MRDIIIKLLSISMFSFYFFYPHSVMAISSELNQELNNDYFPSSGGSWTAPSGSSSNGGGSVPPPDHSVPPGDIYVIIKDGSTTTVTIEDNGDGVIDLMDLIRLEKKENDSFSMSLFLDWIYGKKTSDL